MNKILTCSLAVLMSLALSVASVSAWACSTVVVGRRASATGRVIVGHNEDDEGKLSVIHGLVPQAVWKAGERVPAETGCARIPQVPQTRGFYWSEVRSDESGISSADVFLNDAGVLVVSNNGNGGGPADAASGLTDGGLKYVLRRAVAERASSARDAVGVITNLVAAWGYACPGRIYTVADRDEAWLVEIVKGRRFVARRCPDDAVAVVPNCYTVRGLEKGDVVSPDIAARAQDPSFDFYETFQHPASKDSPANVYRWRHMLRLAAGYAGTGNLPFAAVPRRPVRPEDVAAALATHFEGTLDEVRPHHGPQAAACGRTAVCRDSTVESTVCVFGTDLAAHELRVATGAPCRTPVVTFRPFGGGLPAALDRSSDAARRLAGHFLPVPDSRFCLFAGDVRRVASQRKLSLVQAVALLKAAGVTGFDAGYGEAALPEIVRAGLPVVNVYGWVDFDAPDGGAAVCAKFLSSAVANGATRMMIIPGDYRRGGTTEADYLRTRDGLRRFVPQIRAAGIIPLVEDFGGANNVCSFGKYLRRMLADVPELDFALDSGNLYYAGRGDDILEMMHAAKGRISHVHLKDQLASDNHAFVTLGRGAVPNAEIVRTVTGWGYDGWFTLENPVGDDLYADIVRQIAEVRRWRGEAKVRAIPCRGNVGMWQLPSGRDPSRGRQPDAAEGRDRPSLARQQSPQPTRSRFAIAQLHKIWYIVRSKARRICIFRSRGPHSQAWFGSRDAVSQKLKVVK